MTIRSDGQCSLVRQAGDELALDGELAVYAGRGWNCAAFMFLGPVWIRRPGSHCRLRIGRTAAKCGFKTHRKARSPTAIMYILTTWTHRCTVRSSDLKSLEQAWNKVWLKTISCFPDDIVWKTVALITLRRGRYRRNAGPVQTHEANTIRQIEEPND